MNNHCITAIHKGSTRGRKVLRNVVFHCVLLLLGGVVFGVSSASIAASLSTTAISPLPQLSVPSNGVSYSGGAGSTSGPFLFKVRGDAGWGRLVKNLSYSANAKVLFTDGLEVNIGSKSDPGFIPIFDRARKKSLDGYLSLGALSLASACNVHADNLRGEGLTNTQIFGEDRTLTVSVRVTSEMDIVAATFDDIDTSSFSLDLVCKQWGGVQDQGQATQLNPEHGVHNAELTLIEQSNIAGLCQVKLNATLETTDALAEVKFRYQHGDGQQSGVETITTSEGGLALITDTIPIPNGPGEEIGTLRIVGVSPSFTSNVVSYSMNCSGAGTAIEVSVAPSALLQGTPIGFLKRKSQTCPTHLNLQGAIEGHGGSTVGKAYFLGPDLESPFQTFTVNGQQTVFVNHLLPLVWKSELQLAGSQTTVAELMSQSVVVGFHVLGENNIEVAQVPQRTFNIACNPAPPTMVTGSLVEPAGSTQANPNAGNAKILIPSMVKTIPPGSPPTVPVFSAAPAQPGVKSISVGKADLMATTLGLSLAGGVHPWGTTVMLNNPNSAAAKGLGPGANLCRFSQSAYRPFNKGVVASGFFNARVSRNNQQINFSNFNLPANSGLPGNGWHLFNLDLAQGMNTIQVKLDVNNSVAESNENNNLYHLNVQVNFPCSNVGKLMAPANTMPALVPVPGNPQRVLPQNNNIKTLPGVKPGAPKAGARMDRRNPAKKP